MEDWDFWLKLASKGYWGATIPEYLTWCRRRGSHDVRWSDCDEGQRQRDFGASLRETYAELHRKGWPAVHERSHAPYARVDPAPPAVNRLAKSRPGVLLVLPWLRFGGADKFNLDLVAALTRSGWNVSIATTLAGDNSWSPDFAALTPDVFLMSSFLPLLEQAAFLAYLVHSRRHDVVLISHSELAYLLLPSLRLLCPGVAFVDYCHIEEEYWKSGGYPRFSAGLASLLDGTAVTSHHLKGWMVAHGGRAERIEVVYVGVDCTQWRPDEDARRGARERLAVDDSTAVLLYPARISYQKQPLVFARTVEKLAGAGLRFVAVVAGDGEDRPSLERFINERGLSRHVRLLGAVPNPQVRGLMQASDMLFLPSRWEGIALTIYEAMAVGLPVVGANVGGQAELVTCDCGVLVDLSDEETQASDYARAITELVASPERRCRMAAAARRRVETSFTVQRMGEAMQRFLSDAAARTQGGARPVIGPDFAPEQATQAIEFTRMTELADRLWAEQAEVRTLAEQIERTSEQLLGRAVPAREWAHLLEQAPVSKWMRLVRRGARSRPGQWLLRRAIRRG